MLITVVIDKKTHFEKYGRAALHPYHYCLAAMLERYCGFLNYFNALGDVMAESRGGTEDKQLKAAYRSVYDSGTFYWLSERFQKTLTSKEIKLKQKSENIAGIQLPDLIAHPSKRAILIENNRLENKSEGATLSDKIAKAVEPKYNRRTYSGRIQGYGKVFLK